MTKEIIYKLADKNDIQCDKVKASSFKTARSYFAANFTGKFTIYWTDNGKRKEKNVRL